MNPLPRLLPLVITLTAALFAVAYGPIAQPPDYHAFADPTRWGPLPHAADVLSNLGFLAVAATGWWQLRSCRNDPALATGWPGYRLFLLGLVLTAFGSAFYHHDPDNARLVWDRLPIALACAGLLAAVWAEAIPASDAHAKAGVLALVAVCSVAWWHFTELQGRGDLRPYLLLQLLPLMLIPLWQAIYRAPRADRIAFGLALILYAVAKAAEWQDRELLAWTGWITGHTLKHLLSALAAAVIVARLRQRTHGSLRARRRRNARHGVLPDAVAAE